MKELCMPHLWACGSKRILILTVNIENVALDDV